MKILHERPASIPRSRACDALRLSRTGTYPRQRSRKAGTPRARQPRRLTDEQRQQVLDRVTGEAYQDARVRVIYARELNAGRVLASVSTIYRILAAEGQSRERRAQRPPQRHPKPRLTARAPNEAWSWDIERHEALSYRTTVGDRRGPAVAAAGYKLRAV